MKLSKNQKKVILEMRKGVDLIKMKFIGYSSVSYNTDLAIGFVHKSTFNSLYLKGLISVNMIKTKFGRGTTVYSLTDLGKTISLS